MERAAPGYSQSSQWVATPLSQTGIRVDRSNSCKGPAYPVKGPKNKPKSQTKIFGPASVIWDQISEIWSQKGQPGNPDYHST